MKKNKTILMQRSSTAQLLVGIFIFLFLLFVFLPVIAQIKLHDRSILLPAPRVETLHETSVSSVRLLHQVDDLVSRLRTTHYRYGGNTFNIRKGIYFIDCSHYIDHLLAIDMPKAFASMRHFSGNPFPTTRDYYLFFHRLPLHEVVYHWYHLRSIYHLRPGDVIVYLQKSLFHQQTGHVMLVTSIPRRDKWNHSIYHIAVSDAALAGHDADTRRHYQSGIGMGTLLMRVKQYSGRPYQFAWKIGAHWQNVMIAIARPMM